MTRFVPLRLSGLCLAFAAAVYAVDTLTLDDCIRLALAAPSRLTVARQEADIAHYGVLRARSAFLPQFQVGGGYTYNTPPSAAQNSEQRFVALNGVREYSTLGSTSLELDISGRLRAGYARAQADAGIAAANQRAAERDLKRQVAAAYYRLLLARHLLHVSEEMLAEASSFENRARQLFRGGEVAQADVVKAAAQVAFLQQALLQTQLDAKTANYELASFWTSDVRQELPIEDTLARQPQPVAAETAGAPFARRFEFNLLEAQRQGFQADYRAARAQRLPQLALVTQYGIDANRLTARNRGTALFLTLNVPVFDWFRARSLARQFQLRTGQVNAQRDTAIREFSRDYAVARARVELLFQQIDITDAQVRGSEDNLRLARVRYEGGEGPALDVVTAQSQLAQARANYFGALAAYANARADLEVASGR